MSDMQQFNSLEDQIRETVAVPDANPEFVSHLRGTLANRRSPAKKPWFVFRPAWAVAVLLIALVIAASLPGAVNAVRQWFGFIPGIGLVEQSSPLQVSEAPVTVTRDGVTLTVQQVITYADHIDLAYRVEGIPAKASDHSVDSASQYCTGPDMYPVLLLPDGARIAAKPMALGSERLAAGYIAGHSFPITLPPGLRSANFTLKCLQETKRGAAPEDWVVPFSLVNAPQGKMVGNLLKQGSAPEVVQPAQIDTRFSFLGGVAKENGYHFFFHFSAQSPTTDMLAVQPASMYLLDSSGKRIELINALPWSPFDHVDVWEYRAVDTPASGPMTLIIDGVQVYYLGQKASFEFSPGKAAQVGQSWKLDEHFTIGGHDLSVTSASMVEVESHKGFEFSIEADQPGTKLSAEVMDMTSTDPRFSMWSVTGKPAPEHAIKTGFVYESAVPETLKVTFNTITVLMDGSWKVVWDPSRP